MSTDTNADDTEQNTIETDTVRNRSELLYLFDAMNANPNGNPLSGSNRPRIDPDTQVAIVTDVRLKRYIRDQLEDDGHHILITGLRTEEGDAFDREELMAMCVDAETPEEAEDQEGIFDEFRRTATDVRYFGATMSVDPDDSTIAAAILNDAPGAHIQGPVQFSPATTLHAVAMNTESNSLTSVIGTQKGKSQGGYQLDDHRIKYGLFAAHGLINERAAEVSGLTQRDVDRFDTVCWRSLKNQATSRSKLGQEPRLYLRVEYGDDQFQLGDLHQLLEIRSEKADKELRSIRDLHLDVTELLETLHTYKNRLEAVHVVGSDLLQVVNDGETGGIDRLYDALGEILGDERVHIVDPARDYIETLPEPKPETNDANTAE
ncbi:type I-B CRISPR-associated protein Cas7/Csh2 (plasmid) [Haloferacaceae archaeon DSL9]